MRASFSQASRKLMFLWNTKTCCTPASRDQNCTKSQQNVFAQTCAILINSILAIDSEQAPAVVAQGRCKGVGQAGIIPTWSKKGFKRRSYVQRRHTHTHSHICRYIMVYIYIYIHIHIQYTHTIIYIYIHIHRHRCKCACWHMHVANMHVNAHMHDIFTYMTYMETNAQIC